MRLSDRRRQRPSDAAETAGETASETAAQAAEEAAPETAGETADRHAAGPSDDEGSGDIAGFDAGVAAGLDPQEEATDRTGDSAVTHLSSPWNHRLCTTCGHSFRRGDRVRLTGTGPAGVAHLAPELRCAGDAGERPATPGAEAGAEAPSEATEATNATTDIGGIGTLTDIADFAAGVLAAWPPLDGVPVTPLRSDDWQVARPVHGARPPRCLYCGHTFRAGEHVVVCPCRPDRPACGASVHRDPVAGLICWESWRPQGRLTICPVTLAAVRE